MRQAPNKGVKEKVSTKCIALALGDQKRFAWAQSTRRFHKILAEDCHFHSFIRGWGRNCDMDTAYFRELVAQEFDYQTV
jgi:hypothetical protein